jgi:hypothetical protein
MFTRELHLQSQELKFVLRTPPAMSLGESHAGVLVLVALVVDIRAHVEVDERRDLCCCFVFGACGVHRTLLALREGFLPLCPKRRRLDIK